MTNTARTGASERPSVEFPGWHGALFQSAWIVPALFLLALAIRLWGLDFGLPHYFSGDEVEKRSVALQLAERGFVYPDPQPGFVYNTLFLIFGAARVIAPDLSLPEIHYLGRLWMAVLGSLTVIATWKLGTMLGGRAVGAVGAALVAVVPLHTATSRYIKEDTPLALAVTLALVACIALLQRPNGRRLVVVGAMFGLACSTKFTALLLALPVGAAMLVVKHRHGEHSRLSRDVLVLIAGAIIGFLVVSPAYALQPRLLLEAAAYQLTYAGSGHDGISIGPWSEWWTYYLRNGLAPGLTLPVMVLGIAGLWQLTRLDHGWVVALTVVAFYLTLESSPAKPLPFPARYLVPIVPALCVAASLALSVVWRSTLAARLPLLRLAVAAVVLLTPLTFSVLIALEATHDTRTVAAAWMEANLPAESRFVVSEDPSQLPASEYWGTRWEVESRGEGTPLTYIWHGAPPPYFIMSSFKYQRFLDHPASDPDRTAFYSAVMNKFRLVKEFTPRFYSYGKHSPVVRLYQPDMGSSRDTSLTVPKSGLVP